METQVLVSILGREITSKAIIQATASIYQILSLISRLKDRNLAINLESLDIKAKIKCVESIISYQSNTDNTKPMLIILEQLHEIICRIREDLRFIHKQAETHQMSYLSYIWGINLNDTLKSLRLHKDILDQRLDMFMKVLTVENSHRLLHFKKNKSIEKLDKIHTLEMHPILEKQTISYKNTHHTIKQPFFPFKKNISFVKDYNRLTTKPKLSTNIPQTIPINMSLNSKTTSHCGRIIYSSEGSCDQYDGL